MDKVRFFHFFLLIICALCLVHVYGWGGGYNKVKLSEVETLTLYKDRQTTGRRSNSVPQLQCVGGSAGCSAFVPQVVQCYNRGSSGRDIQWECKTDMDNEFRFGKITVSCEGYDYPEDKYILEGSCGLEYTLDLTKEGYQKKKSGGDQHSYYQQGYTNDNKYYPSSKKGIFSGMQDIIVLAVVCIIIYGIYKTCIANQLNGAESGGDGHGPDSQRPSWFGSYFGNGDGYRRGGGSPPPSYGFRQDYMPSDGCGGAGAGRPSSGAGNFWTGAATGGILGYMLGNRGNQANYSSRSRGYDTWGGTTTDSSSFRSGGGAGGSSGTRTASGFGETRRR